MLAPALPGHPPAAPGRSGRPAPSPWPLRLLAALAGALWFALDVTGAIGRGVPAAIPALAGVLLAAGTAVLVRRWSAPGRGWTGAHALALASGALAASLLFGLLVSSIPPGPATAVQLAVTGAAGGLLVAMGRRLRPSYSAGAGAARLGPDRDPALVAPVEADRPAGA